MKSSKSKLIFYIGSFGMLLFMIGDWLLDAAGAGDEELGLIAHTNWPQMAMWRFVVSATLALVALLHQMKQSELQGKMQHFMAPRLANSGAIHFVWVTFCL